MPKCNLNISDIYVFTRGLKVIIFGIYTLSLTVICWFKDIAVAILVVICVVVFAVIVAVVVVEVFC